MTTLDPVEVLRSLTRGEVQVAPVRVYPDAVLARISRTTHTAPSRRTRRFVVAGAIIAVAGAGTVTWALTTHGRPSDPSTIACHQSADLRSSQFVVAADGSNPAGLCSAAWSRLEPTWGDPPPLVACTATTGVAVVFPGDETTCASLGLSNLGEVAGDEEHRIIAFEEAVTLALAGRCVPPDEVRTTVQSEFANFGLDDWTMITTGSFDATQPCGSVQFDPTTRTVYVQPLPDLFSPSDGD